jgi:hypothetical protein
MLITRSMIAGSLTFTVFIFRAWEKVMWGEEPWYPIAEFFVNPYVVFIMFLAAANIIMFPFYKGIRALVLAPFVVGLVAFFVYAYYILP